MNCVHPLYQQTSRNFQPSYNFIHLTLQEFLTAVHIWINFSKQEQSIFFETQKSNGLYKMIILFLAGLTQFKDPWTRCVLPVPQNSETVSDTKVCSYSAEFILWLYESQNEEIFNFYETMRLVIPFTSVDISEKYVLDGNKASPHFYSALGYVIAAGKFHVEINHIFLNSSHINFMKVGLKMACSSTLKRLSIPSQRLKDVNLAALLQCFDTPVGALHIYNCKDASFSESLPPLNFVQCVKEIELNDLSSGTVKWLKHCINLRQLKLNSVSSRLNFQELSSLIIASPSLSSLELSISNLKNFPSQDKCQFIFGLDAISMKPRALSCSDFFNIVDSDDVNSLQKAVIASLQNFSSDLKYFKLMIPMIISLDLSDSLFQAIFACSNLQNITIDFQTGFRSRYDQQWNHPTLLLVDIGVSFFEMHEYFSTVSARICQIFGALQRNTSVKSLIFGSLNVMDGKNAAEFGSLLQSNTSLVEIEVQITILSNRDALVAMLEHVANATHLKKFSILCARYSFDFSTSISLAVCKILERNSTLQYLKIPLFLEPKNSFIQPIIRALSHSTLQSLIFKHTLLVPGNPSLDLELSNEVAESLGEMLLTNKSLQTFHLPALFPDYTSIVRGLANNNIIEAFLTHASAKRRIMECSDYPCVWSKIIFDTESRDAETMHGN